MHIILLLTNRCNSKCNYCFANKSSADLSFNIFKKVIETLRLFNKENISLCFHGGEPLMRSHSFFIKMLKLIDQSFQGNIKLSIQSNLWNLDEQYLEIFRDYNVSIGTSIDGPQQINDFNRGFNYFERTMMKYEMAKEMGVKINAIATFTPKSLLSLDSIYKFFFDTDIDFDIHPAIPNVEFCNSNYVLPPQDYLNVLESLFALYIRNYGNIQIRLFEEMVSNLFFQQCSLCQFTKCLGDFLAISPKGELYPCNRFIGLPKYSFGSVEQVRSINDIKNSQAWALLDAWYNQIQNNCAECSFIKICNGGCPYIGLQQSGVDPYCTSIKSFYNYLLDFSVNRYLKSGLFNIINNDMDFRKNSILKLLLHTNNNKINTSSAAMHAAFL